MIVKDEVDTVHLALDSVLPHVNGWVISDTGSTDGTQEKILNISQASGVGGKLLNHNFIDFSTNRNIVLDEIDSMGCFDYAFVIDADDELYTSRERAFEDVGELDYYSVPYRHGNTTFTRCSLFRCNSKIRFINPVHEIAYIEKHHNGELLKDCYIKYNKVGNRSRDVNVLLKDLELLKKGVNSSPNNLRMRYHLANTYAQLHNRSAALREYEALIDKHFSRNVELIGDANGYDTWISLINMGEIRSSMSGVFTHDDVISPWMRAFDMKPWRAEPMARAAWYCHCVGLKHRAFMYSSMATALLRPTSSSDQIYIDEEGYNWRYLYEHFKYSQGMSFIELANDIATDLLRSKQVPENIKKTIMNGYANVSRTTNQA